MDHNDKFCLAVGYVSCLGLIYCLFILVLLIYG